MPVTRTAKRAGLPALPGCQEPATDGARTHSRRHVTFAMMGCALAVGTLPRVGWAATERGERIVRLARSIAVGMVVYHWLFAPGDGTYGRLLWGSC